MGEEEHPLPRQRHRHLQPGEDLRLRRVPIGGPGGRRGRRAEHPDAGGCCSLAMRAVV